MNQLDQRVLLKIKEEIVETSKRNVTSQLSDELISKIENKEKLTVGEQLLYLKAKKVKFTHMSEDKAFEYLNNNSYYYKVTAYKHNFPKNNLGYYINLDFGHLVDIAIIDMHLRYLLIQLSLDIEHSLKTKLINFITEDVGENGYSILEEYNDFELKNFLKKPGNTIANYVHVKDKIFKVVKNKRDYNYETYIKGDFPVWKLVEMMSYGQLASFIRFYVEKGKYKSTQLEIAKKYLYFSKNIRDSAAHSRPLLLNIVEINQISKTSGNHNTNKGQAQKELKIYVENHLMKRKRSTELLTNFRIHDLCSLIYLHDTYVGGKFVRKVRKKELFKIYKRALYRKGLYSDIPQFNDFMKLIYSCIRKYKI